MRFNVILAVLKRNLMSYFSGVLGYLFIVVFVISAACCAFNAQFFTNNLATLDQLTQSFPFLLLFIVPAITMTAWADEKRQGTDELLFTLPATDFEILLGKYLSLVMVYSVALTFSLTKLVVLGVFADPDWGLLLTTYFGYWLAGSSLISLGMFASSLTSSVTVAFVLGSAICAIPTFIGQLSVTTAVLSDPTVVDQVMTSLSDFCGELSVEARLAEFATGILPLSGLVYFLSLIVFSLYLNLIVISKRHWVSDGSGVPLPLHFVLRVVCLLVALICGNAVITTASQGIGLRFDMTAENLYTLSDTTSDLIDKIDKEKGGKVTIQAYISPQVPREYVGHQTRLKGLLRQYDRMGGQLIEVRFVDVMPYSEAAEEAEHFGITPNRLQSDIDGRIQINDVFMGAVVSSAFDQVIIPFFELGSSIEYELTRSIRTVSQEDRLKIGMLRTDGKVNGGFDMSSMRSSPEWRIQQELKKQYDVVEISPDSAIAEEMDCLVAVLPSSLTDPQMANLVSYVNSGKPVLILDDPLPLIDPRNSPSQPKPRQGGGMFQQGPPPEPRASGGTAKTLVDALDIEWQNDAIIFEESNPHPQFADVLQQEYAFVTPENGNPEAISTKSDITRGLQELLVIYAGRIRPRRGSQLDLDPLLRSGPDSGIVRFNDVMTPGIFGMMQINPEPNRELYGLMRFDLNEDGKVQKSEVPAIFLDAFEDRDKNKDGVVERNEAMEAFQVIAAHIHGEKDGNDINAIYVADVDLISDALFNVVQGQMHDLKLDNIKFILNCVDFLAGDDSYLALRNKRQKHRTLKLIQQETDRFREASQKEREKAEKEAEDELEKAREQLQKVVDDLEKDETLSPQEKSTQLAMAREDLNQKLRVKEAKIEQKKNKEIERLKAREQRQTRASEVKFRFHGIGWPPVPSLVLGVLILFVRLTNERRDIEKSRLLP